MIFLPIRGKKGGGDSCRLTVLFGEGLIGGAIVSALDDLISGQGIHRALTWGRQDLRREEVKSIRQTFDEIQTEQEVEWLDIVWSAGRVGFGSSQDSIEDEWVVYRECLELCSDLICAIGPQKCSFHLISSAGGLFEGQTSVHSNSVPNPLRPYGELKVRQEAGLSILPTGTHRHIYRPSSVYGYSKGGRMGLIPTLIYDSLRYRPSRIVGNLDTCRDYIYCGDIGNFVSSVIENQPLTDNNFLLASGKPTTIQELVRLIENETGHPLYLSFDPVAPNSETNSYRKSGLPPGLKLTALNSGIKRVKYKIFKDFTFFP